MLDNLRRVIVDYYRNEASPQNGLIADRTQPGSPSSIAATGMGLSVYIVAVERNLLSRADAVDRTLAVLRFLHSSHQGPEPDATGYKGFYYHFLDMQTGRRAIQCELSTIDTAILMAGVLTAASYFTAKNEKESEIRKLAELLYRRIDWRWALDKGTTISHGWNPESGFLSHRWDTAYSEAIILYALALGSPTFPIDPQGYEDWISTFEVKKVYDTEYLYAGPLFIHQMSHLWVDFRGIHDDFNRKTGIDYFENSRRATYVHRQYAIENPMRFAHYSKYVWGLTASDGPGDTVLEVNGVRRAFFSYAARGAPFGPDDGTVSPWAVATSLPFAPDIVIPTIHHIIERLKLLGHSPYGFVASYNPTYPEHTDNFDAWASPWIFGLNEGPVVMMIENFHTELVWKTVQRCPYFVEGLKRAGFRGGWLDR
ncbi:MAG TPA: glucoamylase family protein [Verrucomicrobiae bacterium]|nr:glucoamylase family protein [Verrucomicrobiae bacterium]